MHTPPVEAYSQGCLQKDGRTPQHVHADHALFNVAQGSDLRARRFQLVLRGIHAPGEEDGSIPIEHAQPVEPLSYVKPNPVVHHLAPLMDA